MGNPEQPITNRMKYGKVRRYKCRKCGRVFKDYYLTEEKRVCIKCTAAKMLTVTEAEKARRQLAGLRQSEGASIRETFPEWEKGQS